jgi:hypothetical protein
VTKLWRRWESSSKYTMQGWESLVQIFIEFLLLAWGSCSAKSQ